MNRLKSVVLYLRRYYRSMGLRVVLYAMLSLLVTFIGPLAAASVNELVEIEMTFSSVTPVLTILASSMLAVSTFSLNIMVSAHRAAASATTPRVHRLLLEDTTTQSVLAAFIGAFVYSLSAIILYRAGFYQEESALLVMGVTVVVVLVVVLSLLRWISHLSTLGSVDASLDVAYDRAKDALLALAHEPGFGARPVDTFPSRPGKMETVPAPTSGFVQIIDVGQLHDTIGASGIARVMVRPGVHVLEGEPLVEFSGELKDKNLEDLAKAFTLGRTRTHEQDAEFGLTVLAEAASRALSPGINDSGTAIQAISLLTDLLWAHAHAEPDEKREQSDRVFADFAQPHHLVDAGFSPIARDGARVFDVAMHLRRSLAKLENSGNPDLAKAARQVAELAVERSRHAGLLDQEIEELRDIGSG